MMRAWLHRRWMRRVALLAVGALDGHERTRVELHVETCPGCRELLGAYRGVWRTCSEDPSREAELPVGAAARLRVQVARQIEAFGATPEPGTRAARSLLLAGAAAVVVVAAATISLWYAGTGGAERHTRRAAEPTLQVPDVAFERMERHLARTRAVRYLAEARDVLVNVASETPHCDRQRHRVDVAAETQRSRELLVRRDLVVDVSAPEMAAARNVLEDVERTLRDVAALDPCADPEALLALRRDLTRGQLLMKIDLVSQELMG